MLTLEQLQEMLSDLESDRIERTTSTSSTDKFAQAVCAFANDYPNHREPGYWSSESMTMELPQD